jgi:hypothetical protein
MTEATSGSFPFQQGHKAPQQETSEAPTAITRLELWVGLIYDASLGFREE